ncbi:MAG: ribosome-associated translation inhibitor RaiA [bacterium]|nr:ribosome-associated translation inhibitor RaiA [bacterium]
MKINLTSRHMEVTPSLQDYAEKKLKKVVKYFPKIKDVQITLDIEKSRHKAEVKLIGDRFSIQAEKETTDMYASIDQVVDKIERQLKRYKEKFRSRKKRYRRGVEKIISLEKVEHPTIIKTRKIVIKPMSIEEVVMQMDLLNRNFIVFENSETAKINVIYKRKAGNFGLIEP